MTKIKDYAAKKYSLYKLLNKQIEKYDEFPIIIQYVSDDIEITKVLTWANSYINEFNKLNVDNCLINLFMKEYNGDYTGTICLVIKKYTFKDLQYPPCIFKEEIIKNIDTTNYDSYYKIVTV